MIDDHCRRGGRAVLLERSDLGEMIVIRHGRRAMQLAWTHLLPATFGGKAKMNVQNSLAAAGAAFAAGASCTTSGRACGRSPRRTTCPPAG